MHDSRVWEALKQSTEIQGLIFKLLLDEPRQSIRKGVAEIIFTICGTSPPQKQSLKAISPKNVTPAGRHPAATTVDIVATLWKSIMALFPETLKFASSSQEFFEVALATFQTVACLSPDDVVFGEYLRHWGDILLSHRTREVGEYLPHPLSVLSFYPFFDPFISGLSFLYIGGSFL
jgi:ubiquitin carboxyl-terminal hydrolase 34